MEIADTLDFLLGSWTLDRSIVDHRAGQKGSFSGSAILLPPGFDSGALGERASYEEQGELRFGHHRGAARRRLGYARLDDAAVMVHFADGRPFVELDLRSGAWRSVHQCGADRYEMETVVRSQDEVVETWRVRGPSKDYDAVTTLVRAAGER